jgi:hypothetical protein
VLYSSEEGCLFRQHFATDRPYSSYPAKKWVSMRISYSADINMRSIIIPLLTVKMMFIETL